MGILEAWARRLGQGGRIALDAVLPPRCIACGAGVDMPQSLCADCWGGLTFIDGPVCTRCGLPFEHEAEAGTLCGGCIALAPVYDRARAALRYDEASRGLVLAFKHGDRLEGARLFGRWLVRAAEPLIADADLIAPVPLHPWRLFLRLYNQSALLAGELARLSGGRLIPDLLRRTRWTPSQAGRNADERRTNVRRAFGVMARYQDRLAGRRVLLVDDVFTTGATVEAAAGTLLKAGASAVDVVALARVVRPQALDL